MSKTVEEAEVALQKAQEALKNAEAAWHSELERDCERREGSGAQERRRELHREELKRDSEKCRERLRAAGQDLEDAKQQLLIDQQVQGPA